MTESQTRLLSRSHSAPRGPARQSACCVHHRSQVVPQGPTHPPNLLLLSWSILDPVFVVQYGCSLVLAAATCCVNTTRYACVHGCHRCDVFALLLALVDGRRRIFSAIPCAGAWFKSLLPMDVRNLCSSRDRRSRGP